MSIGFLIGLAIGGALFVAIVQAVDELVYRLRGRPWPPYQKWPMRISNLWTPRKYDIWTKTWSDR